MYDADSLAHLVMRCGFEDVQERGFLESAIPGIEEVELAERVLNGVGVCVEGVKPSGLA